MQVDIAAFKQRLTDLLQEVVTDDLPDEERAAIADAVAEVTTEIVGTGEPAPEVDPAEDDAALVAAIKRVGPAKAREIQQEYQLKADFWRENGVTLAQHLNRHATRSAHIETPESKAPGKLAIPDAVRIQLVAEYTAKADFWKSVGVDVESYVQKHGRAMALRMEYRKGKAEGRMREFDEDTYVAANS